MAHRHQFIHACFNIVSCRKQYFRTGKIFIVVICFENAKRKMCCNIVAVLFTLYYSYICMMLMVYFGQKTITDYINIHQAAPCKTYMMMFIFKKKKQKKYVFGFGATLSICFQLSHNFSSFFHPRKIRELVICKMYNCTLYILVYTNFEENSFYLVFYSSFLAGLFFILLSAQLHLIMNSKLDAIINGFFFMFLSIFIPKRLNKK